MTARPFPVRPNLEQLRHQAKDLLKQIRTGDPGALADLQEHHPQKPAPSSAKLADAQLVLARSYGLSSWPRLVLACQLTEAIWQGETSRVHALVLRNPHLLHE